MLRFFRVHAAKIGWAIVIFFAGTMFTGGLFFGFRSDESPKQSIKNSSTFASLGAYPIDPQRYFQLFQGTLQSMQKNGSRISPIQLEQVMISSFQIALEEEMLYIAATEDQVSISSDEKNAMEQDFLLENNIKSKSELKKILKENKVNYKSFQKDLDKELLIRKYKNMLFSNIVVTDSLVEDTFKSFKYSVVVVENDQLDTNALNELSLAISEELNAVKEVAKVKESYEKIVSLSYMQKSSYVDYLNLESVFRDNLVNAVPGTFIEPFCKESMCLIANLVDVQMIPKPDSYKKDDYVNALTQRFQQEKAQERLSLIFNAHPLSIEVPELKAVYYKSQGDFQKSLSAYQEIASQYPASSIPHFFRSELLFRLGQYDQAMEEIIKADLKSELANGNDFPELHLFYGDILIEDKNRTDALSQYQKAQLLAGTNISMLRLIQQRYIEYDFLEQKKAIDEKIAVLDLEKKQLNNGAVEKTDSDSVAN